jgi:hypothetical protein
MDANDQIFRLHTLQRGAVHIWVPGFAGMSGGRVALFDGWYNLTAMFDGWGSFYGLVGGASATLIGIMAVVATLTSGSGNPARAERGQRLFLTPTVFHMAAVLFLSALTLAPRQGPIAHAALMAVPTAYGLGYAVVVAVQLWKVGPDATAHWSDFWCYGVLPVGAYAATLVAIPTAALWPSPGRVAIALCLLALLMTAIRNAWDLVIWLAPRREAPSRSDRPAETPKLD